MSLEVFNQLESRIQNLVNSINTLKQEISMLQKNNQELEQLINESSEEMNILKSENENLKQEQLAWQSRMQTLLTKISEITQ